MKFYTLLGILAELENLSLEELLEIKQKVDKLIHSTTSNSTNLGNQTFVKGSYSTEIFVSGLAQDSDIDVSSGQQMNIQNDMQDLDSMIALVLQWQQDESGYDEEVYPKIEAALNLD
ncbi:hypothetical protein F7734_29350 [Scytonema sp. UIC 10036]|uniref:hypothetical protein n=1 Tax=Scytonema sp. UIC 10036 TaxID=2304196 RepID=UPI0012DA8767|nr:hypothetical protein [Scytonema sp. UIC 10036]MUG96225.1 hypothetical protein [Scytonema sp. UIC 10036]